ncbi:taste receptor, type 2, member 201, tandem duplicate 1 [Poecilia formosa]|uniref:taste receptor, type 2, member 201, tandem duplicate 1 n=1 Tax=Poecilia formosa TaxID=48698 RepID=UPI0007B97584|nr:PREDICTED: uncharacterized protein LOC107836786 [Poecilia formosa]
MFLSEKTADRITEVYLVIALGCLSSSVSSSVWLNFFYYTQIVPAHRAIFIWFKKNIKPIIFCILLLENIYELLNQTVDIYAIMVIIKKGHFYLSFVVMMTSSCITVVYLGMHIRRRVINGQSLSSARLSSQLRVTITGVIQGLLYFSYAVWHEYIFTSQQNLSAFISSYVRSTVVSFYMLGTTFNLGAGQSVFRQQICGAEQWYSLTVVEIQMCLSFEVNEAHCSVSDPSGRAP